MCVFHPNRGIGEVNHRITYLGCVIIRALLSGVVWQRLQQDIRATFDPMDVHRLPKSFPSSGTFVSPKSSRIPPRSHVY